jgi:hypothetical protein
MSGKSCPATNNRDEPCGLDAGWGVEGAETGSESAGPCKFHGGSGGAPENNQNAQTHALFASHDGYYHDLPGDEQDWVFDFTHTLLDRYREVHGKEPDMFDREALKNIAIDYHRVAHANGWFRGEGLVHEEVVRSESFEKSETKINVWAGEIRQYNESVYRRMQKHGLLDGPESQKADALGDVQEAWIQDLADER